MSKGRSTKKKPAGRGGWRVDVEVGGNTGEKIDAEATPGQGG